MAVQITRTRICDVDGDGEGVVRYRISRLEKSARTVTLDLCETDAEPLEKLLKAKPVPRRKSRPVTSIADVKKAAKTTAARKKAAPR